MMSEKEGRCAGSAQQCRMRLRMASGTFSGMGSRALPHPTAPTTCRHMALGLSAPKPVYLKPKP